MSSRTITFRFPEEVIEIIEAQAQATGKNRTAVVMEALARQYGFSMPSSAPSSIETLQEQFQQLSRQVNALAEQLMQLQQPHRAGNGQIGHELLGSSTATSAIASVAQLDSIQEFTAFADRDRGLVLETESATEDYMQLIVQLDHQARMLDQILSANPDIVFVLDRRGRFTYINLAGGRVFGLERSYFLGKTFQELGFSVFGATFIAQCETVFTTGRTVCDEVQIPTAHETRAYEYILSPTYGADGEITTVVSTARDITERKQAELAVRESEEKYRNLFETANDSIFIYEMATQQLLNVNRKAARRLGYTRQELLQLTIEHIHTPMSDSRKQALLQELQTNGNCIFEHWHRHKNGREIPVEISSRVIEYEGKLAVQNFVQDISDRRKVEEQLRLLEAMIFNVSDAIVLTRATSANPLDLEVVYANPSFARMSGYRSEELIGQPLRLLQGPKTDWTPLQPLPSPSGLPATAQILQYRKDGSQFWTETTISPLGDGSEQQTYWMVIQQDITTRRQAAMALRCSQEMLEATEAKLADLEQRFSQWASDASEAMLIHHQGKIIDANPLLLQLFGYERSELLTLPLLHLLAASDRELAQAHLEAKSQVVRAYRGLRKDGSTFPIRLSIQALDSCEAEVVVIHDGNRRATSRYPHRQ